MVNARRLTDHVLPIMALLALAPASAMAQDNILYRCQDGQGNLAFTNSRKGYSACTELGRYPKAAAAQRPAASVQALPPSTPPAAPAAEGVTAVGAVSTATAAPAKPKVQRGAVYRFDRDGVVHYTNVKPQSSAKAQLVFTYAIETCIACQVRSAVDWNTVALRLDEYETEIASAAAAHDVDAALIRAVIHAESAYRVNARSNKGAQGLMQLMPATATRFGVADAYDPVQNIAGGVQYLAFLLKRFNGDTRLAAAGYNAGEGAVDRYGGVPPYAETQVYVERVGILHARYRAALDASLPATATAVAGPAVVTGASP